VPRVSWLSDASARLQAAIVWGVSSLPAPVLRGLSGGGPVVIDGETLEPEVQLGVALMRLSGDRNLAASTPAKARREMQRRARRVAGAPIPMARVEELSLPGPAAAIPARLYVPHDDGARRPIIVYYRGGGWVVGDLETHDATCRFLAREADASVLAVDYRLAPEHRFPAAVEDAHAAFAWAVREAQALCGDPARVVVAGDSAGGNLAAVTAQLAVASGGARPAAQLLFYPATDFSVKRPSYRLFATGFVLTDADTNWYRDQYLPDEAAKRDPRASPLLATDLRGLPPAVVVTAGFDVLRDEGEEYARAMERADVRVVLRRCGGQIHGFANATGVSPASARDVRAAASLLRELL
jgi:acetyl esterase